jgi:hypothetical protein
VLWGFYNGVLLVLHRLYDRAVTGIPSVDRLRACLPFRVAAVVATFLLVAIGLVMVRCESWAGCWLVEQTLLGGPGLATAHFVPVWVPLLLAMVAAGHLFSGVGDTPCRLLELPALVRAATYVGAVVLLVAFAPGVTKAFIYFQF